MTVKERILERLESEDRLYCDVAEKLKLHAEHSELESKYRAIADAFAASANIVTDEFAKEGGMEKHKACPFCGHSKPNPAKGFGLTWIVCPKCTAQGGQGKNDIEAWSAWDRREGVE